jgi:[ribosomal protein S5]-alanine N-acetyltransferase
MKRNKNNSISFEYKFEEINTDRVSLRKFNKGDAEEFYEIVKKHEVGEWLGLGKGMTFNESENYLNMILHHWSKHNFGVWAVINKFSKDMMGHCGLRYMTDTNDVELIYLLDPKFWGQGIATEAGEAVVQYAFHSLNVDTLYTRVRINNSRSKNVIKKLGFTFIENKELDGRILSHYKSDQA